MSDTAFWVEREYDHTNASDGVSRYGAYVRERLDWFRDAECWEDDGSASFAAVAWRIATGPVMTPGYVRCHPKVIRAQVERSDWDGSLLASVDLIAPWPHVLRCSRDWRDGKWWRDWPTETLISHEVYFSPTSEELAKNPYLLTCANLRFSVVSADLPHLPARVTLTEANSPPATREDLQVLVETAQRSVDVLVAELSRAVTPVIGTLDRS